MKLVELGIGVSLGETGAKHGAEDGQVNLILVQQIFNPGRKVSKSN